jgi:hypothetical protein
MTRYRISPDETLEIADDLSVVHTRSAGVSDDHTGVVLTAYPSLAAWAESRPAADLEAWRLCRADNVLLLTYSLEVPGGSATTAILPED